MIIQIIKHENNYNFKVKNMKQNKLQTTRGERLKSRERMKQIYLKRTYKAKKKKDKLKETKILEKQKIEKELDQLLSEEK